VIIPLTARNGVEENTNITAVICLDSQEVGRVLGQGLGRVTAVADDQGLTLVLLMLMVVGRQSQRLLGTIRATTDNTKTLRLPGRPTSQPQRTK
jgi:hypothetical protein